MAKAETLQIMTNAEVSEALNIAAATTRSRIHRETKGKSSPTFPKPFGKFAGAWAWLRQDVEQFIAKQGAS